MKIYGWARLFSHEERLPDASLYVGSGIRLTKSPANMPLI
jgi:hypothetical protein